jgi:hypothetical protein
VRDIRRKIAGQEELEAALLWRTRPVRAALRR